ncbi:MAG TPA: cation-translocating P-type ATPase [Magnetospirillaceae bacterium]|nr:cation-translocating P-type ATPase [Magnetospirillaceae bacterium]
MSKTNTFYSKTTEQTVHDLAVDPEVGLTAQMVSARLAQYGPNTLPSGPKMSAFGLLMGQFKDVLIIVLIVAATISLGLSVYEQEGLPTEALLIYGIVVAIALVGFFNEYKAEKTVEALKKLLSQTCRVRRDGEILEIPAEQLVSGDIVLVDEGKKVPADIRLLQANRLQANESSLTGESLPVNKSTEPLPGELALGDQKNMLFSSTLITTGTAIGVVVATGAATEIGTIARLVSEVEDEQTPMQRKLDDLGKKLGLVIIAICVVVFALIMVIDTHHNELIHKVIFAFTAAVALAVAAIPEGLAFVVRISLALGARRMAAKKALVRKLSAVESLGSTDVICSDKTGTLTKGEMTVRKLYASGVIYELSGSGYDLGGELTQRGAAAQPSDDLRHLAEVGVLCNNASLKDGTVLGDPTEGCLLVSAAKLGVVRARLEAGNPRLDEIPFSSDRRMMTTLHKTDSGFLVASKGATSSLLEHCTHERLGSKTIPLTAERKKIITAEARSMAGNALRVLGFASRTEATRPAADDLEKNLTFIGLQAMMDPPRTEVQAVIGRIQREAGMRVIMITGDSIETAKAVARELGIMGDAITGVELAKLSDAEFIDRVEQIGIYGRVNPADKIRIVQALKHHGHQVAMTGDGVNDAPAIKAADIGIAMGITGTDAAKEASDMILLDDKFVTIINAIEEGRGIFDNVRKFVNFLLSCNIGEVLAVLLGVLIHHDLVLTAAQLLFINIVTDGLPAVALGSDPVAKNVMQFKPQHYQQAIVNKRIWVEIFVFGGLMALVLLAHYTLMLPSEGTMAATSVIFLAMVVYEFVRLLDIRSDFHMKLWSNPLLMGSLIASLVIQTLVLYLPSLAAVFDVTGVGWQHWLIIGGVSVILFGIMKLLNPIFDFIGPEYADKQKERNAHGDPKTKGQKAKKE